MNTIRSIRNRFKNDSSKEILDEIKEKLHTTSSRKKNIINITINEDYNTAIVDLKDEDSTLPYMIYVDILNRNIILTVRIDGNMIPM